MEVLDEADSMECTKVGETDEPMLCYRSFGQEPRSKLSLPLKYCMLLLHISIELLYTMGG